MRLDDDELGAMLRDLDPAVTPEDASLTVAQLAMRDRITGVIKPTTLSRRSPLIWWSTLVPAVATVVIALVVALSLTSVPRAVALTPSPLTFTKNGQTAREVLAVAQHTLDAKDSPEAPVRGSETTGWYMQVDDDNGTTTVAISPQITTVQWKPDQSGRVTIIAGTPYWADGSDTDVPPTDAPAAGAVLSDMTMPAGNFQAPSIDPPPTTAPAMTAWLTVFGLPTDADSADLIDTITYAMSYWTMTNHQHAILLQLLLHRDDVRVEGTGTDRAGRSVIGVSSDSNRFPGSRRLLLISTVTGRIVAEENLRTAPQGKLPAGSVISYTLWGLPNK